MKTIVLKKESNITFEYENKNLLTSLSAKLIYVDEDGCYLSTDMPADFVKPAIKTPANIIVKSQLGVFKSKVAILDSTMYLDTIIFLTKTPKEWDIQEYRRNSRISIELPISIVYEDGYKVEVKTLDISIGGLSFIEYDFIPDKYKKQKAKIEITLDSDTMITVDAKCIRSDNEDSYNLDKVVAYKFSKLTNENEIILKRFIKKTVLEFACQQK